MFAAKPQALQAALQPVPHPDLFGNACPGQAQRMIEGLLKVLKR